jgi:hypothetical protein
MAPAREIGDALGLSGAGVNLLLFGAPFPFIVNSIIVKADINKTNSDCGVSPAYKGQLCAWQFPVR